MKTLITEAVEDSIGECVSMDHARSVQMIETTSTWALKLTALWDVSTAEMKWDCAITFASCPVEADPRWCKNTAAPTGVSVILIIISSRNREIQSFPTERASERFSSRWDFSQNG